MALCLKLTRFGSVAVLCLACRSEEDPPDVDPARPTTAPVTGNAPPAGSAAPGSPASPGSGSPGPEVTTTNPLTPAAGNSPAAKGAPAPGGAGAPGSGTVAAGSGAPSAGGASGTPGAAGGGGVTTSTAAVPAGPTPPNAADSAAQASELSAVLTDEQIAKIVDDLNRAEIEQARLALAKSQNESLRSFAQMMIDHHTEANRELDALQTHKNDSVLAQKLLRESQTGTAALQQASGIDVDRAYATGQVDAHQKALTTLQQRLLPSTKGTALGSYLKQLEERIEQHLGRARSLSASLGKAAPPAGDPAR